VVTDFEAGFDKIEFRATGFADVAQVFEHTIDTAEGAKILVSPTSSILLQGVFEADLQASDIVLI
jgi:hypothetical protein